KDIVSFDVEVLGVESNGKGAHDQILARASGPVVDEAGGIIHGMSGSPVYVDGKLIGAVARGISADTDPHVFYITPIEDMLKIWELPDTKNRTQLKQVDLRAVLQQEEEAATKKLAAMAKDKTASVEKKTAAVSTKTTGAAASVKSDTYPVSTPLLVAGFTDKSLDFLKGKLAPFALVPYSGGSMSSTAGAVQRNASLQPGSSVSAAFVYGDFTVGATGTVTAVDGSRILAFGHPYTYLGNVNFFMTDASVIGAAGSLTNGTKIASFGNIIGRINQDRYSGISGIIGTFPSVVPIQVTVKDHQTNQETTYSSQIAYDEKLLPAIGPSIAYAAMDKTIDRQGLGTAKVSFEITTSAVDGGKIVRDNMYFNGADVGPAAVSELGQVLDLLSYNDEGEADVLGIKVKVELAEGRQTASLLEAVPDKPKVKPGDTLNFKVKIKPYRQPVETIIVPYTVPKTQADGPLNLELRGGGLVPVMQLLQQGLVSGADLENKQSFKDKIKEFLQTNKNNEIIITPAVQPLMTEKEQMAAVEQA
ncbi:MAG: SpoIVB peptidase S55 domain-containing protein, partial [Selenomonadaceae bacterium]